MSYRRSDADGWIYLAFVLLALTGVAAYWILRFCCLAVSEGVRIYAVHGSRDDRIGSVLRWTLIAFGVLVASCLLVALLMPTTTALDILAACSGFLLASLVVTACGHLSIPSVSVDALDQLDTYLDFTSDDHHIGRSSSTSTAAGMAVPVEVA